MIKSNDLSGPLNYPVNKRIVEFVLTNSIRNYLKMNFHMDESQGINMYYSISDVILNLNSIKMDN